MSSRSWKLAAMALPIAGSIAVYAAFTSPPFGGYPPQTVYVKRIYNSDGSSTATLEYSASDYDTVMEDVTATEARWVLASLYAGVVTTQWWTGGDIYELRVA